MIRHDRTEVKIEGVHSTLGDALSGVRQKAQSEQDVQFHSISIQMEQGHDIIANETVTRYVSLMEGFVR
jgi:anthranilate/para-aminobenzoate synthase component II